MTIREIPDHELTEHQRRLSAWAEDGAPLSPSAGTRGTGKSRAEGLEANEALFATLLTPEERAGLTRGRPMGRTVAEGNSPARQVRLPQQLDARLSTFLSEHPSLTRSEVIRQALDAHLSAHRA